MEHQLVHDDHHQHDYAPHLSVDVSISLDVSASASAHEPHSLDPEPPSLLYYNDFSKSQSALRDSTEGIWSPQTYRAAREEYLKLNEIVRAAASDEGRRTRANDVRARIEDLMVSGQAAEEGSLRVLRAALSKADRQRLKMRMEEKRVSRARAKMRFIEDNYFLADAPPQAAQLQRDRACRAHMRVKVYCALREQLKIHRAISRLATLLRDLAALLKALIEEYDQISGKRSRVNTDATPSSSRSDSVTSTVEEARDDQFSLVSLDVVDSQAHAMQQPRSFGPRSFAPRSFANNVRSFGKQHPPSFADASHSFAENAPSSRFRFRDRPPKNVNSTVHTHRNPAEYDGNERSFASSTRFFRSARFLSRAMSPSERADSELNAYYDEPASESTLRLRHHDPKVPIISQMKNSVYATKALSRFTMARLRLPSTAKKHWVEANERYGAILNAAPHLIERRLVPLESIEDGILGEWPARSRSVPGRVRVEAMVKAVESAIDAVKSIAQWQDSLVGTIRADYAKHRDALRRAERSISELYVEHINCTHGKHQ